MPKVLLALIVLSLTAACTATLEPPKAKIVVPAVSVGSGSDSDFCPPGQAKKGRC